eukprot:TRINITY_DN2904_c0_g1_i1.p1 TRINITY_DN2904_c0_g1~~TRINITY_DN2904_c0_g1_i1.p1  ORF type:complete len:258 (-),score=20.05 TRINITY_DN2904_c0_g1_i1:1263-2036(-)
MLFSVIQKAVAQNKNIFQVIVPGTSSSTIGIQTFLNGGSDLAASMRLPITQDYVSVGCVDVIVDDSGVANATCLGKQPTGLQVGRAAVAVITHPSATISDVSIQQLIDIFINTTNEQFLIAGPELTSDAAYIFQETIDDITSEDYVTLTTNEDIVNYVANNVGAIAFIPFYYVADRQDIIKILTVQGQGVSGWTGYPLSTPLYLIYDYQKVKGSKFMRNFICFMLSWQGQQFVSEGRHSALSSDEINSQMGALNFRC